MRLVFGIVTALVVLAVSGCGGSSSTATLPDPTIKFVNVCPTTTNLAFDLNLDVMAASVPYATASGEFTDIDFKSEFEGGYDVILRTAGGVSQLDNLFQVYNRDTHNVVVSYGLVNPAGELSKRAQLITFPVDRSAPTGNRSRLIVLNAYVRATGFETPAMDFQSFIPGDASSIENPQYKLTGIEFGSANISAQSITVDSGSRSFLARRNEVTGLEEFARLQNFTLNPGRIYLVILTGQEGNATPSLLPALKVFELTTKN